MNPEILAGMVVALIVLALLALTIFRKQPASAVFRSDGEIRAEVDRYRAAIKSRTLCERCLSPNPAKSNYCAECGAAL